MFVLLNQECSECETAKKKLLESKKKLVYKPIHSESVLNHVQFDMINMCKFPYEFNGNTYTWILTMRDLHSKLCIAEPLKSKTAFEVTFEAN